MEWSTIDCLNLIAAYQQHPILWNPHHPLHGDKEKKQDAWVTIGRLFGCPPSDVRKKMDSLLRSYRREKTKVKNTYSNDNGTLEVYVSNWYAYNRMSFLDEKLEIRTQRSSTDIYDCSFKRDEPSQKNEENQQLSEAFWSVEAVYDPEPTIPDEPDLVQGLGRQIDPAGGMKVLGQWNALKIPKEPKLKSPSTAARASQMEASNPINDVDSRNHSVMDNHAVYGQHVGNKLRGYSKRTKSIVEYHINNILFQADMGHFESRVFERSHKFNTFRY